MSTWIKICGLTRVGDVAVANQLAVDAVGLVLAPSPRRVTLDEARRLREALVPEVACVALLMDAGESEVASAVEAVQPDLLQFHGRESPAFCARFGLPYIKALSQANAEDLHERYTDAWALLIDSHEPGAAGGTGRTIDASRFPGDSGGRWLLAGGLNPANVAEWINRVNPWGVDVSSGVEAAPGQKDHQKMTEFVTQVRHANGD